MKKIIIIFLLTYSIGFSQWNLWDGKAVSKTDSTWQYDSVSLAYFGKMTVQLPDSVKQKIDFIIRYFKTTKCSVYNTTDTYSDTTIFQRYDHFWFTCLNDSNNAKIDVKGTKNLVNKGNAFTQWKGWYGHAGANYISTGYIPETDAVNYQLNYASYQCYISTMTDVTGNQRLWVNFPYAGTHSSSYIWSADAVTNYLNGKYHATAAVLATLQYKMITVSRTNAKLNYFLSNTLLESVMYDASDGVTETEIVIGFNTDALIGYFAIGGNFTIKDVANINAVIIPFMQWLGN